MTGRLVLVGTPIGNLDDMAPRAIAVLAKADLIACEDTRRTGQLLQKIGVTRKQLVVDEVSPTEAGSADHRPLRAPLLAVHQHNETERIERILSRLRHGDLVALVTDAGMPGISDPGEHVVRAVVEAGITIEVVPGPTAGVAALVKSGFAAGRYCFEGFLPRKGSARTARLADLVGERRTMVLFEAPHRLARTIDDLVATLGGERMVSLSRELTKLYEETWRGTLGEAVAWAGQSDPRGEFVVVVEGAPALEPATDEAITDRLRRALAGDMSTRDAVTTVAADLALPRRRVYNLALELKG